MRRKPFYLVEKSLKTTLAVENYYSIVDGRNPLIDVEKHSNSLPSVEDYQEWSRANHLGKGWAPKEPESHEARIKTPSPDHRGWRIHPDKKTSGRMRHPRTTKTPREPIPKNTMNHQDTKAPREAKARHSANCPMISWCLGVLVVKGFEEVLD
jgi:hypothetical protein